jgi:hypothetical protein
MLESRVASVHILISNGKYAKYLIQITGYKYIESPTTLALILERNLLTLDLANHNLGRVLGNNLVVVQHLKLL